MNEKTTSRVARWGRLLFLPYFGCSRSHLSERKNKLKYFLGSGLVFFVTFQSSYALQLKSDTQVATAGYFHLSWTGEDKVLSLEESGSVNFDVFKNIYTGTDRARVVSGKPNGEYYYRLVTMDKNKPVSSNVVKVIVRHHSLKNAILFFIAGFIVFIATFLLIINGKRWES
jgi:hypothetical protein